MLKLIYTKIVHAGINEELSTSEKGKIVLVNFTAFIAIIALVTAIVVDLNFNQLKGFIYDIIYIILFTVCVVFNRIKWHKISQAYTIILVTTAVLIGDASYNYALSVQYMVIYSVTLAFIFFRKSPLSFQILLSAIVVLISISEIIHYQSLVKHNKLDQQAFIYNIYTYAAFSSGFFLLLWYFNSTLNKSEKELQELAALNQTTLEKLPVGVTVYEKSGACIAANPAIGDIVGTDSKKLLGQSFHDIKSWKKSGLYSLVKESIKTNTFKKLELELNTEYGRNLFLECSVVPLLNRKQFMVIAVNVSERKKTEEKLRHSNALLVQANQSKNRFFSIIAHDLRGPLSSIVGVTELLANKFKDFDDEKMDVFLKNLNSSAANTYNLLLNLLDWSRTQLGKTTFNPKNIDINSLATEVLESIKHVANKKNISIQLQNSAGNKPIVGDEEMLKTVTRNLVSNAIKFTPHNGLISINIANENNYLTVNFTDTGIGMSKETMETLFDISQNRISKGTDNEKGTGLGLIICKEFIDLHKGELLVESIEGKGSTFGFKIPIS